jgi:hypothetical protein
MRKKFSLITTLVEEIGYSHVSRIYGVTRAVSRKQFHLRLSGQFLHTNILKKTPSFQQSIAVREKFFLKFNRVVFLGAVVAQHTISVAVGGHVQSQPTY